MNELFDLLGIKVLIGGGLVAISILLGFLTSRLGMPLLLIFLGMGMLAGEDGPGRIEFNDHELSFWLANVALAVILLDGGLRTSHAIFRVALKPSLVLATLGVLFSCGIITGLVILVLDLSLFYALLIGAIISSTDAAAVFNLLKNAGARLNERVEATLEIESGINDPMAIFLTIIAITFILNGSQSGHELNWSEPLRLLALQVGVGFVIAYIAGLSFVHILRRLRVESNKQQGLNALLTLGAGLFTFGLSTLMEGSGFLSIYIFGLILARHRSRFVRAVIPSMDGLAWLFQAIMFLLLGLLVTPTNLVNSLAIGLGIAAALIFVARPVAVFCCLIPFGYTSKEMAFISWVGLRGAVPIVLAIFPIIAGVDNERQMLDLALIVVLASLLIQGSTIRFVARILGLTLPEQLYGTEAMKTFGSFTLDGSSTIREVSDFYNLELTYIGNPSLADWMANEIDRPAVVGDVVQTTLFYFVVKEMSGEKITKVGVLTRR